MQNLTHSKPLSLTHWLKHSYAVECLSIQFRERKEMIFIYFWDGIDLILIFSLTYSFTRRPNRSLLLKRNFRMKSVIKGELLENVFNLYMYSIHMLYNIFKKSLKIADQKWISWLRHQEFIKMHLHFESNVNTKCDCTILSLSWMGKVPDDIPEVSLNTKSYSVFKLRVLGIDKYSSHVFFGFARFRFGLIC